MGEKMSVDRVNKVFEITEAPTLVDGELVLKFDIKIDLYSDAKEDWLADSALRIRKFPLSAVGGNPTVGSKSLGSTYFIDPDWKIKLYEENHRFLVNGNFYSTDGTSPFLLPASNSVLLEQEVSSLVDSTVNQLPEIEGMSFDNKVSVDVLGTQSGTAYPSGNTEYPVNNVPDAVLIAWSRGKHELYMLTSLSLGAGDDVSNLLISGIDPSMTTITIETNAVCNYTRFQDIHVIGVFDGDSSIEHCTVGNIDFFSGTIAHSSLNGTIALNGIEDARIHECAMGDWDIIPTVNMNNGEQDLIMTQYTGMVNITNATHPNNRIGIGLNAGQVIIDASCTEGTFVISGDGTYINNGGANVIVDVSGLNNPQAIANAVLDSDAECP